MSNAPASLLSCRVNRQSALVILLGRLSKFAPFKWFFAQVGWFSVEITEEGWKLWDAKGCHAKDSPFSCETAAHFFPEVQTLKTLKCKCPHWSDWLWWGYLYIWMLWASGCREDHGLAELILWPVKPAFSPLGACGAASCCLAGCSRCASKQIPALRD